MELAPLDTATQGLHKANEYRSISSADLRGRRRAHEAVGGVVRPSSRANVNETTINYSHWHRTRSEGRRPEAPPEAVTVKARVG